jgi:hypothetical protein
MRICIDCKNASDGMPVVCSAPQIGPLTLWVIGKESPGATLDATEARLNPGLCGTHGQWFEPKPEPTAETEQQIADDVAQSEGLPAGTRPIGVPTGFSGA